MKSRSFLAVFAENVHFLLSSLTAFVKGDTLKLRNSLKKSDSKLENPDFLYLRQV